MASNAEHQKTWYQENAEKCAEYQQSYKKSMDKYYLLKKGAKFPPSVSDFCADTLPNVFEEAGCAVCGKLTPICEMEELSEVENINLLKFDGVTRNAVHKSSDPVEELREPILAPSCNKVCPKGVESLDNKKCQLWLLQMAFGLRIFQMNYKI